MTLLRTRRWLTLPSEARGPLLNFASQRMKKGISRLRAAPSARDDSWQGAALEMTVSGALRSR